MRNFYNEWLRYWDDEQEERAKARKCIHEEALEWVRTKQDYRAALLCSRQNKFITAGDVILGEIPKGWHSGTHSHGEEAIYIIEGRGFSVIDDRRYDWDTSSCLFIPFGVRHQHFNSGDNPVRYLSATALALERFIGLAKLDQWDEAGETPMGIVDEIEKAESDIHPKYGRIVLRLQDAPVTSSKESTTIVAQRQDEYSLTLPNEMRTPGAPGHRARHIHLMETPETRFNAREVLITGILCDAPGMHSGKHAHMEAVLYVLQGHGYSIIDGERIDWKKGTLLQVQGPQTVHQHFNTGEDETQQLRIHYGIRSHYFQPIAHEMFPYRYYEFSSYR